jgi:hypothetical protein
VTPRVDVDDVIQDDRWRAAVEAAFAGCDTPREGLYTTRVLLAEFLGGVTATLFTASIEGERLIDGPTPFGETPEELFDSLRERFTAEP